MLEVEHQVIFMWSQIQESETHQFYVHVWEDKNGIQYRVTIEEPNGPCMIIKYSDRLDEVLDALAEYINNCKECAVA